MTYGTAGCAVEALLALDGDVSAVGSLELDIESRCSMVSVSVGNASSCKLFRALLTLAHVVEVLVDKLSHR